MIFIIGASGAGKSTVVKAIEDARLGNYKVVYFDSIGTPSLEEMHSKYNGPEEFQRIKTLEVVKKIKSQFQSHLQIILDGQIRPAFIQQACVENKILDYKVILFDCSDDERKKRLIERGQPELANDVMMNWAKYLREECQKEGYEIINNTHLKVEETLLKLIDSLK